MRVNVNGTERDLEPDMTVAKLVASFQLQPRYVAVEINCDLVPRRDYDQTQIREGDQVEIVTLVGGG